MKPTVGFTLQITTICKNITDRWTSNCDRFCIISEVALKSPSPENRTSAKKVCIFPCSRLSITKDWTTRTVTLHPGTLWENEPVGKRHSKLESGVHRSRWNGSSANYWEFEHWKKKQATNHTHNSEQTPPQTNKLNKTPTTQKSVYLTRWSCFWRGCQTRSLHTAWKKTMMVSKGAVSRGAAQQRGRRWPRCQPARVRVFTAPAAGRVVQSGVLPKNRKSR